jgi:hypothetical protein
MLGNYWLDEPGKRIAAIDGRVPLPELQPDAIVRLLLPINAPAQIGNVQLVIDIVEEGSTWFHFARDAPVRTPMKIVADQANWHEDASYGLQAELAAARKTAAGLQIELENEMRAALAAREATGGLKVELENERAAARQAALAARETSAGLEAELENAKAEALRAARAASEAAAGLQAELVKQKASGLQEQMRHQQALAAYEMSTSWKMTKPMRWLKTQIRRLR